MTTGPIFDRIQPSGARDTSFNNSAFYGLGDLHVGYAIAVQPDGKYLLSRNRPTPLLVRVNTNGTIDGTLSIGSGFNNQNVNDVIVVQPDGKIIFGGSFTSYNGVARSRIARLNVDGSLDTTFNVGTGFNNAVLAIALQSDGKILVGGTFTSYNGVTQNRIARLNVDGSLDTTFNIGTGFNNSVFAIAIQSDGKILVGGLFTSFNGIVRNSVARLLQEPTLQVVPS